MKCLRYIAILSAVTMSIAPGAIGQPRITSKVIISPEVKLTDQEKKAFRYQPGKF